MALALVGPDPDVSFYAQRARPEAPLLVLGCGNGRVALALAETAPVVGVDPSEGMIRAAEERRAELAPARAEATRFLCADLRSVRLDQRFGLVLAPQSALSLMGSLADLGALLATVSHHLGANGQFIFDVTHPRPPERPAEPGVTEPHGGVEPVRPVFAPHLRERPRVGGPGAIRRLRLRHFDPHELDAALKEAGLVARERYGSFQGKPYDVGDNLQVVVAGPMD